MFLSGFIQKPLSGFDVLALGAFVSACEQQEQGVLLGGAIYAVSGSEVEPQFQNLLHVMCSDVSSVHVA